MKHVLIGSVSSTLSVLEALGAARANLVGVCGLDAAAAAGVSDYVDLAEPAARGGARYVPFRKISEPALVDFLTQARPDFVWVIGLSQIFPERFFALAARGCIGFHPTRLPEGRGRAPVAWTILLQRQAASNLFWLSHEADAGDLLEQRPVPVLPDDYARDLIDRTNVVLGAMVRDLVPRLERGELPRTPQNHADATWYGRRGPEDGLIDWTQSAEQVHRLVRAASRPYPGAFTWYHSRKQTGQSPTDDSPWRIFVWRAQPHDRADHVGTVGQIVRIDPRRGVLVQCGSGLLWLTEITQDNEAPLNSAAFREGSKLGLGPRTSG